MITTWYLQSQRTWDRLCHSCIGSSFLPRGAFPEGGAYAVPQRLHAGSLEALRVSRPEAVVLAVNKLFIFGHHCGARLCSSIAVVQSGVSTGGICKSCVWRFFRRRASP